MMPSSRRPLWIASGLFVLSGATGLVYETIWFKSIGHVWGNSSLAMACVVSTFLAGLGLGAWLFGRWADRSRLPLALYGWCEIAIGVLALVIPFELDFLARTVAPLSVSLVDTPIVLVLARFGLTWIVIGPPCVLMGATLPLLTRQFAASGVSVGASAAWLYAANTFGAALGAWLAGFLLLEMLGLTGTNALAASFNIAVGFGALVLAKRSAVEQRASTDEVPPGEEQVSPIALSITAAATGFASIALQMLWARDLALLVGGTTYAFSATLATFILGLGLGSLWFRLAFADRPRLERPVCFAAALVVGSTLLGAALRPSLALVAGTLREMRANGVFNAAVCASTAAVLQLLPSVGMGLLFPALVQLARKGAAHAGRTIGGLYAWNTLGSIAGAALTALVVLPAIGSFWSMRGALFVYSALPLALLGARSLPLATGIACLALLFARWKPPDPIDTNCGAFLYGAETVADTRSMMEPLSFAEGSACNVLVLGSKDQRALPRGVDANERLVNLRVNGKIDASNGDDMPLQLGLAYVPRFLRPHARRVLVIGMGSGVTAGASALFPDTQVTVCEIEPAVVEATRFFEPVNHAPLSAPNVQVVIDDGRSFVQGHPGPWDLILSEPSNPWIAGIGNLFTEEFYRAAQSKLAHDGILAQWVQTYSFSYKEYALVVRTITSVFPHCVLVRINAHDTMILASSSDVLSSGDVMNAAQALVDANATVQADLTRRFGSKNVRSLVLSKLWLDAAGLRRFLAGDSEKRIHRDGNLALEFAAPRQLFQLRGSDPALQTTRALAGAFNAELHQRLFAQWSSGTAELDAVKQLKTDMFQYGNATQAVALIVLGLAYDPEDTELAADRLLLDTGIAQAEFQEEIVRLVERSPRDALWLGRQLSETGQRNAARVVFERLTAKLPSSSTAWINLSLELRALGKAAEADNALAKARELDPIHDLLSGFEQ